MYLLALWLLCMCMGSEKSIARRRSVYMFWCVLTTGHKCVLVHSVSKFAGVEWWVDYVISSSYVKVRM